MFFCFSSFFFFKAFSFVLFSPYLLSSFFSFFLSLTLFPLFLLFFCSITFLNSFIGGAAATNLLRCVPNVAGVLPAGCDFEGQRRYFHVLSTIGPAFNYLGTAFPPFFFFFKPKNKQKFSNHWRIFF